MRTAALAFLACLAASAVSGAASAREQQAYGPNLEGFAYPHPVRTFGFESQGQPLSMAYMDVAPTSPAAANGRTAVLLHGKNFCGATWEATIAALASAGWRVVVPDQIGFCKSTKPMGYQFSLHQLAANTNALLRRIGVERAVVLGHSMGGMLAARYALMFPDAVERLVLVNPIGLEDWKAEGVPWRPIEAWYARELKTSFEGIRNYQRSTYYAGEWRPEYDRWVDMLAGMTVGQDRERVAWNQAQTSDMVFSQPVVHEFGGIRVPTLLLIGTRDNTAIGKDAAPPEVAKALGNYAVLGRRAAQAIPDARLVEFADLGHSPQVQAPERFHRSLLEGLGSR